MAAYHVLLTASTVLAFGLRYPFQDQFRLNLSYLTVPFPQSLLRPESGHRPIVPGVVRLIELDWLGGTQLLQEVTSWLAAGTVVALLILAIARDLRGRPVLAAACVCAVCSLLLWNANARMFFHSYETVHIFYVLFFVVIAIYLAFRAPGGTSPRDWILAIAACVLATFTFGSGIGAFAALMAVAVLRRSAPIALIAIALSALATFWLYFSAAPGAEGVQGAVSAFSIRAIVFFSVARVGAIYAEIARFTVMDLATQTLFALLTGALAIAMVAVSVCARWMRRLPFSNTELFGVGLFVFGLTVNGLIATGRADYFFEYPAQLFADRYLFWSCVIWTGISIYGLSTLVRTMPLKQNAAAVAIALFAWMAVAPAVQANVWASEVHRISELAAVAMRLGISDDELFAVVYGGDERSASRVLEEMRKRHLGMFAESSKLRLGEKIQIAPPQLVVPVDIVRVDNAGNSGHLVRRVSGIVTKSLASDERGSELWLTQRDGTLIGRAAFTGEGVQPVSKLRLGVPTLIEVQGYITQSDANEVLLVAERNGSVKTLASLKLRGS